jgi:hypothetical protein
MTPGGYRPLAQSRSLIQDTLTPFGGMYPPAKLALGAYDKHVGNEIYKQSQYPDKLDGQEKLLKRQRTLEDRKVSAFTSSSARALMLVPGVEKPENAKTESIDIRVSLPPIPNRHQSSLPPNQRSAHPAALA